MPVIIHDNLDNIPAGIWNDLVDRSPVKSVFQSYEWHRAVVGAFGAGDGLYLICVREGEKYLAIAPFFRSRRGESKILRFIGDERSDYCDFIYDAREVAALREVFTHLQEHPGICDEVALNNIPERSATHGALRRFRKAHGFCVLKRNRTPCPVMMVRGYGDFVTRVLAKKSLRRHRNYFANRGSLETRHLSGKDEILPFLEAFFTQHVQRWSGREDQSLFIFRENREFYRRVVKELAPTGRVLFTIVLSNGEPIAFHLGFLDGDNLIWYKPSFEPALAKHYPGEVLLNELITYARNKDLNEFDFTRGDEFFKTRFANRVRHNVSLSLFRNQGRCVKLRLKALLGRVPFLRQAIFLLSEIRETVHVLRHRRKIIESARSSVQDQGTFDEYFDSDKAVSSYRREAGLQKPEAEILRRLRPELKAMNMLDVGAGAGRTSVYFANMVNNYVAVDLSVNMIRASRDLHGDFVPPSSFLQGDARRLSTLDDHSFDLVLISFNGIDCVAPDDRRRIFEEVRRVAKKGAWFCFSSHNLHSLTWRGGRGLGQLLKKLRRYLLLLEANRTQWEMIDETTFAMICDGGGQYRFPVYYIAPKEQVKRLNEMGFKDVRIFSLRTGQEVERLDSSKKILDSWVYYLCRV